MCSESTTARRRGFVQSAGMHPTPTLTEFLAATAATLMLASAAHADRASESKACKAVKLQIRHVESRMRAGYTAGQGVRLETRLKKLRDKRFRVCR